MVGLSFVSSLLLATTSLLIITTNAEGGTRGNSSSSTILDVIAINNDVLSDIEGQACSTSNECGDQVGDSSSHFCKKNIGTCSDTTLKSGVCTQYNDIFCSRPMQEVCGCDGVVTAVHVMHTKKGRMYYVLYTWEVSFLLMMDVVQLIVLMVIVAAISAVVKNNDEKVVELMKKESTSNDPQYGVTIPAQQ